MEKPNKILESKAIVRFQDCDPFNHLNNAKYFDYFLNAREDQLIANYGLNIYQVARTEGVSWVVSTSKITYLKPAVLMEVVMIESQVISYTDNRITVELRMFDHRRLHLKAIMWMQFAHYNLKTNKSQKHDEKYMDLFKKVLVPVDETSFDERCSVLIEQMKSASIN